MSAPTIYLLAYLQIRRAPIAVMIDIHMKLLSILLQTVSLDHLLYSWQAAQIEIWGTKQVS